MKSTKLTAGVLHAGQTGTEKLCFLLVQDQGHLCVLTNQFKAICKTVLSIQGKSK
jgi:hypothetical protein